MKPRKMTMKFAICIFSMLLMLSGVCFAQGSDSSFFGGEAEESPEPSLQPATDSAGDDFAPDVFDSEPVQGERKPRKPATSRPEPVTKLGQPIKPEKRQLTVTLSRTKNKVDPKALASGQPMQQATQAWFIHCDDIAVDVTNEEDATQYSFKIESPLELKTISGSIVAESLNYSNGSFELTNVVISMGDLKMFADILELDAWINSVSVGPYQRQLRMPIQNFTPNSFDDAVPYEPSGREFSPAATYPSTPLPANRLDSLDPPFSNDDFRPRRNPETNRRTPEPVKPQPRQPKPAGGNDSDFEAS